MYDKYGEMFVCASLREDMWYEFRDHRWHRVEKGISLRKKITDDVIPRYLR